MKFRKEFDSIGSINVPNDKYWGASTQRSKKYFDIGDFLVRPILIKSIAIIKKAAAIVHFKEKQLPKKISNAIESLNPFEEKRDFFATSVLSESINLQFDGEGRISLTSKLLKHAKIRNSMIFVGQGKTFQIWEPTIFEKFKVNARKKANLNRASLKWESKLNN